MCVRLDFYTGSGRSVTSFLLQIYIRENNNDEFLMTHLSNIYIFEKTTMMMFLMTHLSNSYIFEKTTMMIF